MQCLLSVGTLPVTALILTCALLRKAGASPQHSQGRGVLPPALGDWAGHAQLGLRPHVCKTDGNASPLSTG